MAFWHANLPALAAKALCCVGVLTDFAHFRMFWLFSLGFLEIWVVFGRNFMLVKLFWKILLIYDIFAGIDIISWLHGEKMPIVALIVDCNEDMVLMQQSVAYLNLYQILDLIVNWHSRSWRFIPFASALLFFCFTWNIWWKTTTLILFWPLDWGFPPIWMWKTCW